MFQLIKPKRPFSCCKGSQFFNKMSLVSPFLRYVIKHHNGYRFLTTATYIIRMTFIIRA